MESKIEFRKVSIPSRYGISIKKVYYVIENGRSTVIENFRKLDKDTQEQIKALIGKMATNDQYRSPKIKYNLKGYNYGEIRPMPHRFFFFQQFGDHLIFFEYLLKKRDSFNDETYRIINQKKEKYEKAFKRYIQRS